MRRTTLLLLPILLLAAWPASAGAWSELPAWSMPRDGVAACVRAAGDGQVALLGPLTRDASPFTAFAVDSEPAGLVPTSTTTLGWLTACPAVASAPGAATLVAGAALETAPAPRGARRTLRSVAVRVAELGGEPVTLARVRDGIVAHVAAATAPGGAAVVAWVESPRDRSSGRGTLRVAVRPRADAPFAPARTLDRRASTEAAPLAGIDAAGGVTVVWARTSASGWPASSVHAASTRRDGTFAAARRLCGCETPPSFALAVAPNGRTLIAAGGIAGLRAWERLPGSERLGRLALPSPGGYAQELAVAVASDGGAVVALRGEPSNVVALLRPAGGRFAVPRRVAGRPDSLGVSTVEIVTVTDNGRLRSPTVPEDEAGGRLAAALGDAGAVALTWVAPSTRSSAAAAFVAAGTLTGGLPRGRRLGSRCRTAVGARAIPLADGRLGAAWADAGIASSNALWDTPEGDGALHVALPGVPPPRTAAPSPGLTARLVGPRAVRGGQPLRLRVRCEHGPCDVRASVAVHPVSGRPARPFDGARVSASTTVGRAASRQLSLPSLPSLSPASLGDAAPVEIELTACAPDGSTTERLTLRPRMRALAPRPLPRPRGVVAQRVGDDVEVRWHTQAPAPWARFVLVAEPDIRGETHRRVPAGGRTRFAVRLRQPHGSPIRTVQIAVQSDEQVARRTIAVPVR